MAFCLLAPGRPVITEFKQVGEYDFAAELARPAEIESVSIAILRPLPEGAGISIFYSLPPFESGEFLGVISQQFPSQTWDTPWALLPNIREAAAVRILISVKPMNVLNTLWQQHEKKTFERKNDFARRIAKNLYNYMQSFQKQTQEFGTVLVLPKNSLETWFDKFQNKLQKDAKFLKGSDESTD